MTDDSENLARCLKNLNPEDREIIEIAYAFACRNLIWDKKTEKQRAKWRKEFEATARKFKELANAGPCPPNHFSVYSSIDPSKNITLHSAVEKYSNWLQIIMQPKQMLSKPRDMKSGRMTFVMALQAQKKFTPAQIAGFTSFLYPDDPIEESSVRRVARKSSLKKVTAK